MLGVATRCGGTNHRHASATEIIPVYARGGWHLQSSHATRLTHKSKIIYIDLRCTLGEPGSLPKHRCRQGRSCQLRIPSMRRRSYFPFDHCKYPAHSLCSRRCLAQSCTCPSHRARTGRRRAQSRRRCIRSPSARHFLEESWHSRRIPGTGLWSLLLSASTCLPTAKDPHACH